MEKRTTETSAMHPTSIQCYHSEKGYPFEIFCNVPYLQLDLTHQLESLQSNSEPRDLEADKYTEVSLEYETCYRI